MSAVANAIDGVVVDARTRKGIPEVLVRAMCRRLLADKPLGEARTDAGGTFSVEVDERIFARVVGARLDVDFLVLDADGAILEQTDPVSWNAERAGEPVTIVVRGPHVGPDPEPADVFDVQGVVTTDGGIALAGVRVEALDQGLGDPVVLGSAQSGRDGRYAVVWSSRDLRGKSAPDLQVRVLSDDGTVLAASRTLFQAGQHTTADVTVPAAVASRPTEYQRVSLDVTGVVGDRAIGTVDAGAATFLAGRTGWDARSVAMLARAAQLSGDGIPTEHYYAMLRAGLPDDAAVLHRLSDDQVRVTLQAAVDAGVIDGSASIDETLLRHRELALDALRTTVPPGTVSSLGDMLAIRLDADQQSQFVSTYRDTGGDPKQLWSSLRDAGFGEEVINGLKADAALGMLTAQSAPLVQRLVTQHGVGSTADLASNGFYDAARWADVIGDAHPADVNAEDFAAGLALQVRLAEPTLVMADLVRREALHLTDAGARDEVVRFLAANRATPLGRQPVRTWEGFSDLSEPAQRDAKRVERLYQISPSDSSMVALSGLGIDSAMQVMSYDEAGWVQRFGEQLGASESQAIYAKALEVHSTALNLATMYMLHRGMPNVYAVSGTVDRPQVQPAPEIAVSATLEELFGNLDYCACEECKSALSPAAYLVELMEFLGTDDQEHEKSPLEILLGRRPDLQHLLLSCENTNVALAYVDLVNEVLEHYVVHGNLVGFTGHDTDAEATTADLLADPQFVLDAAYDATLAEVSPGGLPFDMPLAHLRLLFQVWDTTLADALTLLGSAADARRERLGFGGAELRLLTDTTFHEVAEYFGEPAGTSIDALNDAVASGKEFCRRTDITFAELAQLLTCRFVNPAVRLVPLADGLGLTMEQVSQHASGTLTDDQIRDLLPDDFDEEPYGGDAVAWLSTNEAKLLGLIVLTGVDGHGDQCDFGAIQLRYANPDMTANRLTGLSYHLLNRFIRIWKKLGWSIELTDQAVIRFLGLGPDAITLGNLDATCISLLARLANFRTLLERRSVTPRRVPDWLALWDRSIDVGLRRDRLAALLKFGTTDLADLVRITGVDPFADDLDDDDPSALRFEAHAAAVKASPLKVVDLDYLLRHDDVTGKLAPREADQWRDLLMLRDGLWAVEADLAVTPDTADLATAQAKIALVYDAATVARFFGLIDRTTTYSVPLITAETSLPTPLAALDTVLAIDPFGQALTHRGVLAEPTRAALATTAAALTLDDVAEITVQGDLEQLVTDLTAALQQLRDAGEADLDALGADHPELRTLYDRVQSETQPAVQAAMIVTAILPDLRATLRAASLRTGLVGILKAERPVIDALTSDADVVAAGRAPAEPVIADLLALDTAVTFDADGATPFLLAAPATDEYVLSARAPAGVQVQLAVSGADVIPATTVGGSGEVRSAAPVGLVGSVLTSAVLTVTGLAAGQSAQLWWQTRSLARQPVPPARLTDASVARTAAASLLRLRKAAMIADRLGLTPAEIEHLAAEQAVTAGFLAAVDIDGTISDDDLHAQWARLEHVLWFVGLRKGYEREPDGLVGLLRAPTSANAQGRLLLAGLLEWDETDLAAALTHVTAVQADLGALPVLRRVQAVLQLVATTLQPASDLVAWAVADPDGTLVRGIVQTLRDRMSTAAWQESMKSVSDDLRNQRRDVLVAYILHHHRPAAEIQTPDQLYEYFLVDVQMDACMQTSRIRLALSTVQLFITRCLMNLEPEVAPSLIRADRWEWMKRYRVWEANRQVFLYPENWLEPELRDSKSPFFRDLESELLKADITDDLAESAYLSYLKKLDDVARLEIVGAFLEEKQPGDADDDVLHVFGRSGGTNREHWYRRYDGYWSPWEKVGLNIDSDLVFPVKWRSQLFVFWFTPVVKPQRGTPTATPKDLGDQPWGDSAKIDVEITLRWGELFQGRWTSPKSTEMRAPIRLVGLETFDATQLVVTARTFRPSPDVSERLVLSVIYREYEYVGSTVTFTSKNSPPSVQDYAFGDQGLTDVDVLNYRMWWAAHPEAVLDTNSLYYPGAVLDARVDQPATSSQPTRTEVVLTKTSKLSPGLRVRPLMHPTENLFEAPFFCSDEHSVFFVQPDETVVTERERYYIDDFVPVFDGMVPKIPEYHYTPVKPLPPRPGDPVPWIQDLDPYVSNVIANNDVFVFDGTKLGAAGPVQSRRFR